MRRGLPGVLLLPHRRRAAAALHASPHRARLRFGHVGLENDLHRFADRLERAKSFWKMEGRAMSISISTLRAVCAGIALLFALVQPAAAQLNFKPTAEAVHEDQLLNALKE